MLQIKPKIFAIANQKGGVGKTTTTLNLAAAIAEAGFKVLVMDLDPQGNASTGLGSHADAREFTTYDVLIGIHVEPRFIQKTDIENIIKYLKVVDSRLMRIESKIKKIK